MSVTRYVTGNLKQTAPGAPFNAVWVRLVSNTTGQTYTSSAASDSQGNYSVPGVPTGSYQIQTAPASSGPWTPHVQQASTDVEAANTFRPTLTPAAVNATSGSEQTFSVPGLLVGDIVVVNPPAFQAGLIIAHARVTAADTLAIAWYNATAGSLTPTSGAYLICAVRS